MAVASEGDPDRVLEAMQTGIIHQSQRELFADYAQMVAMERGILPLTGSLIEVWDEPREAFWKRLFGDSQVHPPPYVPPQRVFIKAKRRLNKDSMQVLDTDEVKKY